MALTLGAHLGTPDPSPIPGLAKTRLPAHRAPWLFSVSLHNTAHHSQHKGHLGPCCPSLVLPLLWKGIKVPCRVYRSSQGKGRSVPLTFGVRRKRNTQSSYQRASCLRQENITPITHQNKTGQRHNTASESCWYALFSPLHR